MTVSKQIMEAKSPRELHDVWQNEKAVKAYILYKKCLSLKIVAKEMGYRSIGMVSEMVAVAEKLIRADPRIVERVRRKRLQNYRSGKVHKIYFIRAVGLGLIKIGISMDVRDRMRTIQTSCPAKLELVGECDGTFSDERRLHKMFGRFHSHGEWYKECGEILEFVAKRNEN